MANEISKYIWDLKERRQGHYDLYGTTKASFNQPIPGLKMRDGASMSVQASSYHYCSPRKDMPIEGWRTFEVWCCEGLLTEELRKIEEASDDGSCDLSDGPASGVPHDVLWEIIQNHGGIDYER